jgi:hypothetical protein
MEIGCGIDTPRLAGFGRSQLGGALILDWNREPVGVVGGRGRWIPPPAAPRSQSGTLNEYNHLEGGSQVPLRHSGKHSDFIVIPFRGFVWPKQNPAFQWRTNDAARVGGCVCPRERGASPASCRKFRDSPGRTHMVQRRLETTGVVSRHGDRLEPYGSVCRRYTSSSRKISSSPR